MLLRLSVLFLKLVLAITFIFIPVSRIFGASTLHQVLSLGVPRWLIWIANVVELGGGLLLLLGLRINYLAVIGSLLVASSMVGATVAHIRAGNLFTEIPWTIIFFGLCAVVALFHWHVMQSVLKRV